MHTISTSNLLFSEGRYILLALIATGILGMVLPNRGVVALAIIGLVFSLYFFRNPERICEAARGNPFLLICPADGKVVAIEPIDDGFVGPATRVSIFLSPFDVHVQWTPIGGKIHQVNYNPGKFVVAYAPKSSDINERNDICILTNAGAKLVVRQIAGFVARRICCWVNSGEMVNAGQKYGMIRFGSRVDIIVPRATHITVAINDRVVGGQTVVGILPT
jgi:phosphatidylserine decarboxylase